MARILLVEDDEMSRDMMTRRLERKGYEVLSAVTGEEAVTKALGEMPDLILMDLNLPEIDGMEATRRIRSDDRGKEVPIIALTAHAMSGDRETATEAGCTDYESKPVEFPRLAEKIHQLLAQE